MGLHLPPNSSVRGTPVHAIKALFKKHQNVGAIQEEDGSRRNRTCIGALANKVFEPSERTIMEHLAETGFAREHPHPKGSYFSLTDTGEALASAHLWPREPLEKADRMMEKLRAGVGRLNKEGIRRVEEVWILGSYMERRPFVGDIDACFLIANARPDSGKAMESLCSEEPWYKQQQRQRRYVHMEHYDANRILGPRRHPMFEHVEMDQLMLTELPTRCQRVYTADKGWVAEDILDRHPACVTRAGTGRAAITITIDQGTFSNVNNGERQPDKTAHLKTLGMALAKSLDAAPKGSEIASRPTQNGTEATPQGKDARRKANDAGRQETRHPSTAHHERQHHAERR